MIVTEIRVKLPEDSENEKVLAYCSITFDDDFVIRDLKVIEGTRGPFLAMPSRKIMERCPACSSKNHLQARYCNYCGVELNENISEQIKLYVNVAHPINTGCRELLQRIVLEAVEAERKSAKVPGYVCKYDVY